ncbi:MAG: hypothetical protein RQ723_04705, partial [Desulfuromonadales bacterium]|nr:hypothetical protein [Desulfuromonadales bacterium]
GISQADRGRTLTVLLFLRETTEERQAWGVLLDPVDLPVPAGLQLCQASFGRGAVGKRADPEALTVVVLTPKDQVWFRGP